MSFQFVENSKINGAARKLIRSHVMKGKNIGKVRPRRIRPQQEDVRLSGNNSVSPPSDVSCNGRECHLVHVTSVPQAIGDTFSLSTLPYPLEPYERERIYQFLSDVSIESFPRAFCVPVDFVKSRWFQYFLSDEAFFHSALALAEVHVNSLLGKQWISPRALQHLTSAYRCIVQNLQRHRVPSDATIASVVSMAVHEDLDGHPSRGTIHMDALQQLVELRGGMAQLSANRSLCLKLCRADIEYTIQRGSYIRFYRDEFPHESIQSMLDQPGSQGHLHNSADAAQVHDPELRGVIDDLMSVSSALNADRSGSKLGPFEFQEIWVSVSYRLLRRHPLVGSRHDKVNDNAWLFGLLALISTFLFRTRRSKRQAYDLLAEMLHDAIERVLDDGSMDSSTILWLLFVGGISVLGLSDRTWLHSHIKTCLINLNLDKWETTRNEIKKFPWIDITHDRLGQELWQVVFAE